MYQETGPYHLPTSREELPSHYLDGTEVAEDGYVRPDTQAMISELRQDIAVMDSAPEKAMATMYAVAREIGDQALDEVEQRRGGEPRVMNFLDDTRDWARPRHYEVAELADTTAADFSSGFRRMRLNSKWHEHIEQQQVAIEDYGIKEHTKGDIELLSLMHTMAHESGHALLGGTTSRLRMTEEGYEDDLHASYLYLTAHPEQAFSGRLKSDVWIQEERFAEGYGRLVVGKMAEAMGYKRREVREILSKLKISPNVSGKPGENQIDHLAGPGELSLGEAVGDKASYRQQYEGELGYAKPLTAEELVDELGYLDTVEDTNAVIVHTGPEDWQRITKDFGKAGPVDFHGRRMVADREQELSPLKSKVKSLGKKALAGALLFTVITGVADSGMRSHGHRVEKQLTQEEINNKLMSQKPDLYVETPEQLDDIDESSSVTDEGELRSGYGPTAPEPKKGQHK